MQIKTAGCLILSDCRRSGIAYIRNLYMLFALIHVYTRAFVVIYVLGSSPDARQPLSNNTNTRCSRNNYCTVPT